MKIDELIEVLDSIRMKHEFIRTAIENLGFQCERIADALEKQNKARGF